MYQANTIAVVIQYLIFSAQLITKIYISLDFGHWLIVAHMASRIMVNIPSGNYQNLCWLITNQTPKNIFQWNFKQNLKNNHTRIYIWMAASVFNHQCVSITYGTPLTHWGRVTHICVGKLPIIDSDNSLSPGRRQAIIWTNAGILLTGPLGTNFSEISIGIQIFSLKKIHLKMSSGKWRPSCLGLNVLIYGCQHYTIRYNYVKVVVLLFPTKYMKTHNKFTVVNTHNVHMYCVSGWQKKPRLIELAAAVITRLIYHGI